MKKFITVYNKASGYTAIYEVGENYQEEIGVIYDAGNAQYVVNLLNEDAKNQL